MDTEVISSSQEIAEKGFKMPSEFDPPGAGAGGFAQADPGTGKNVVNPNECGDSKSATLENHISRDPKKSKDKQLPNGIVPHIDLKESNCSKPVKRKSESATSEKTVGDSNELSSLSSILCHDCDNKKCEIEKTNESISSCRTENDSSKPCEDASSSEGKVGRSQNSIIDELTEKLENALKYGADIGKSPRGACTIVDSTETTPEQDFFNGIQYVVYESEKQMPDIMALITKDLSEPYSIYTYRYFIHNWPKLCFLAMDGSQCVGAIVCKLDMHKNMVKRGYIAMLAVDERFRRKKIGSHLVLKAIKAMVKDDCDEVVLETEITNKAALKLYENLGFVRDKRLFRYYLNGVDAFRLKLWLR